MDFSNKAVPTEDAITSQTASPTGDQGFNYVSLERTFHAQTTTVSANGYTMDFNSTVKENTMCRKTDGSGKYYIM